MDRLRDVLEVVLANVFERNVELAEDVLSLRDGTGNKLRITGNV